ncbi:MAG: glycosyltransferase family 2 protein [Actinomycetota bacterium]|nr:glycosyltransferase family 2 protein [Actinomycetota bacterium]
MKQGKDKKQNNTTFLSVVIPTYNEEGRIKETLSHIAKYLGDQHYSHEIIVIDDGSSDNTVKVVKDMCKQQNNISITQNDQNRGKGYSVRRGILQSRGEFILFSDADLSTPIEEVEEFLTYLRKDYDIAIGSRALAGSYIQIRQPWWREKMGKVFNLLARGLKLTEIKDTQCGFKCFKKDVAHDIFRKQKINHFCFDLEVLYVAGKRGYKIKEIPVQWQNSPTSKVNPVTDSIKMLFDLLKIKFIHPTASFGRK